MMRRLRVVLLLVVCAAGVHAETLRVLFVGNSYTFVHGVPELLKEMARSKGHELEYEQQTPGGRSFQKHWEEGKAVRKMKDGPFDIVVFQNQSFEPVMDPDNMMKYGRMLAAEADRAGAKKLYYLTPAYKEPVGWMKKDNDAARRGAKLFPEMHERLVASYSKLARDTGGDVAPVGVAWKLAYEAMPDVQLHAPDHSHAAPAGAYLTALVFYAALYGEAPVDMPEKLEILARRKGKIQTTAINLDSATRRLLEVSAWQACREFSLLPPAR
jgi:hypothetical protein